MCLSVKRSRFNTWWRVTQQSASDFRVAPPSDSPCRALISAKCNVKTHISLDQSRAPQKKCLISLSDKFVCRDIKGTMRYVLWHSLQLHIHYSQYFLLFFPHSLGNNLPEKVSALTLQCNAYYCSNVQCINIYISVADGQRLDVFIFILHFHK